MASASLASSSPSSRLLFAAAMLDRGQRRDQVRIDRDRRAADREILHRPQGVDAVIGLRRNIAVAQQIVFASCRWSCRIFLSCRCEQTNDLVSRPRPRSCPVSFRNLTSRTHMLRLYRIRSNPVDRVQSGAALQGGLIRGGTPDVLAGLTAKAGGWKQCKAARAAERPAQPVVQNG